MQQQLEKKVTLCERNSPADMKVREGRGEGTPGTGAEISLQPLVKTIAKQAAPCSPWSFVMKQISSLQLMDDSTLEQMGVPEEGTPTENVC